VAKSKPITHVLMVLDRSGSMWSLAEDVRGGFNEYMKGLSLDTKNDYRVSVTLFSTEYRQLCENAPLDDVPVLDSTNYQTWGNTALYDAVGKTITEFKTVLGKRDKVLMVIQTDGKENSSREFNASQVGSMIKAYEATGNWSFLYLGQGLDTWDQAARMGVSMDSYVNTRHDPNGVLRTYEALTIGTVALATGGASVKDLADEVRAKAGKEPEAK